MKFKNLFYVALIILIAAFTACATTQQKNKEKENETTEFDAEFEDEDVDGSEFGIEDDGEDDEELEEESEEIVLNGNPNDAHHIVISKESMTLNLYDSNNALIFSFPVAVGKNYGNKQKVGDMKTPEGEFTIQQIQDASSWGHDFNDGKGYINNCYGNWFIRLKTPPHSGIGIHGTHDPNSIGTRATEGCIRLNNADLDKLKPLVKVGMKVTIETSVLDMDADGKKEDSGINQDSATGSNDKEDFFEDIKENEQRVVTHQTEDNLDHKVEEGETFSSIAKKYETTSKKIEELNPDVEPTKIQIGQMIRVKGAPKRKDEQSKAAVANPEQSSTTATTTTATPSEENNDPVFHTIEDGDTFGNLAVKYKTTSKKIQELNSELDPTKLQIGQKVRIK